MGGSDSRDADDVVAMIKAAGGEAVANYDNVVEGEKCVQTALDTWGRIDIIINNAGILRDASFMRMTPELWDTIHRVHGLGHYATTKAAWPHMWKQNYGRIVNVTSESGLYGIGGQTNYDYAKMGIVGFSSALAKEGAKKNIKVNTIAPGAATQLVMEYTATPQEVADIFIPDFVAPMACALAHESVPCTGRVFQAGGGYFTEVAWQRADGYMMDIRPENREQFTMETLAANWDTVTALPAPHGVPKEWANNTGAHKNRTFEQLQPILKANKKKAAAKL